MAKELSAATEEELPLLELLCTAAEAELTAALRQPLTVEDCKEAFLCAGAWLAAADLIGGRTAKTGGMKSFTVGDVSVSESETAAAPVQLRQQAWRIMAPYCGDRSFAFLGVRG